MFTPTPKPSVVYMRSQFSNIITLNYPKNFRMLLINWKGNPIVKTLTYSISFLILLELTRFKVFWWELNLVLRQNSARKIMKVYNHKTLKLLSQHLTMVYGKQVSILWLKNKNQSLRNFKVKQKVNRNTPLDPNLHNK